MNPELQTSPLGEFLAEKRVVAKRPRHFFARSHKRGLRREEVAVLAEVSITDYARLEQGLDANLSRAGLQRIAETLHLSEGETDRAFALAGFSAQTDRREGAKWSEILDPIKGVPAFACNAHLDVLAFNPLAGALFDFEGDGTPYAKNQLWRIYTDVKRRRLYPNARTEQARLVAFVRSVASSRTEDSPLHRMLSALSVASPAFEQDWRRSSSASAACAGPVAFKSPRLGRVFVEPTILSMFGSPDEFMVMLMATSKGSRSALSRVQRWIAAGEAPYSAWNYGPTTSKKARPKLVAVERRRRRASP